MTRLVPITALVFAMASYAPGREDTGKSELETLRGTWVLIGTESSTHPSKVTFKGDEFSLEDGEGVRHGGTVKLDPKPSPKRIDMTLKEGNKRIGLYKVEDDKFTLIVVPAGQNRPTDFDPNQPGVVINSWKRLKPPK